mmetsp:Transcript_665/g.2000  ORF Transcript_665/g.2000 Transcript_665/m.2000 type:complete len:322 (+) Transcript_665:275-1240(+)
MSTSTALMASASADMVSSSDRLTPKAFSAASQSRCASARPAARPSLASVSASSSASAPSTSSFRPVASASALANAFFAFSSVLVAAFTATPMASTSAAASSASDRVTSAFIDAFRRGSPPASTTAARSSATSASTASKAARAFAAAASFLASAFSSSAARFLVVASTVAAALSSATRGPSCSAVTANAFTSASRDGTTRSASRFSWRRQSLSASSALPTAADAFSTSFVALATAFSRGGRSLAVSSLPLSARASRATTTGASPVKAQRPDRGLPPPPDIVPLVSMSWPVLVTTRQRLLSGRYASFIAASSESATSVSRSAT